MFPTDFHKSRSARPVHRAKQNKRLAAGRQAPTTARALSDGHVGRLSSIDSGTVTNSCGAASAFKQANLQPSLDAPRTKTKRKARAVISWVSLGKHSDHTCTQRRPRGQTEPDVCEIMSSQKGPPATVSCRTTSDEDRGRIASGSRLIRLRRTEQQQWRRGCALQRFCRSARSC